MTPVPTAAAAPRRGSASLEITSLRPSELTAGQRARWHALRGEGLGLDDPFLAPEFFDLVEQVRGGVEVVMLSQDGEPAAFLPLERSGRTARPAAVRAAEIFGVVSRPDLAWDPRAVVRRLGLTSLDFVCMPADCRGLAPYQLGRHRFPCIDLRAGFEAYKRERSGAGSSQLDQARRKARKLERERGPLRFEWHVPDEDAWRQMAVWKSRQYHALGAVDVMGIDWIRELQRRALRLQDPHLAGVFSVLTAGDRPVAAHLGLRSGPVLCWWYTAYDPEFAAWSPGMILMLHVLQAAPGHGIERIDLGQGSERYKASLANLHFDVAEGIVHTRPWQPAVRTAWIHVRDWAQSSGVCAAPLRLLRSMRNRLATQ